MPPARNEQEGFSPRFLTIGQTIAHYQLADEPLTGESILAVLEPLMGTSFLGIATSELTLDIKERLHPKGKRIHAEDLFLSFFGSDNLRDINIVTSYALQNAAIIALHSQSPIAVGLDRILTYDRLREYELMLYEARCDNIYFDQEQTQLAFQHAALQWRFYKHGSFLHAIPLTRIKIEPGVVGLRLFSHSSAGVHDHRFFVEGRRKPLPYLQPEQQAFVRSHRMLYISPQFSFDAARRK
jgi:hypothetical protein